MARCVTRQCKNKIPVQPRGSATQDSPTKEGVKRKSRCGKNLVEELWVLTPSAGAVSAMAARRTIAENVLTVSRRQRVKHCVVTRWQEVLWVFVVLLIDPSVSLICLWWGESLTINLKTANNFLKTKFPSGQQKRLQKIAQWQMNRVIDDFPYM